MRRSVMVTVGTLALTVGLIGSIGGAALAQESPAASSNTQQIRIAYSVDTVDVTQQIALDAAQARVDEINAERDDIEVTLQVYNAQTSVDKQISDVQDAITKGTDVLIFSAVDAVGSLPAAQAAKDAGIKLIDRRPSDPEPEVFDVAFYSNDEARYSAATVDWIRSYLEANPDAVLKIGAIYGAPAQTAQLPRIDAIKALAAEMPDRIQIVAEGYGNWLTETAQNLTTDWLQAHPDMNYVATANDIMALGAVNAIAAAGKTGEIMVSGYDLMDDAVQRIKDGSQSFDTGVTIWDSNQIIDVAVGLAQGTFTDKEYRQDPVYAVSADNVDEYLASQER
jgi:ribose transport system substrate-binding protein